MCQDPDSLARTVKQEWENLPIQTISKVFARLPVVHQLIIADNGDNLRMGDRRGINAVV
jgi:hypothetical protein